MDFMVLTIAWLLSHSCRKKIYDRILKVTLLCALAHARSTLRIVKQYRGEQKFLTRR
jgi:hypothetical protein